MAAAKPKTAETAFDDESTRTNRFPNLTTQGTKYDAHTVGSQTYSELAHHCCYDQLAAGERLCGYPEQANGENN